MINDRDINPCLNCDCYDLDMGCTMPSIDLDYACSIEDSNQMDDQTDSMEYMFITVK